MNRIPNCKLSDDKSTKNKPRGYLEELVATIHGCDVANVLWNDTKPVRFISSYVGILPFSDNQTNLTIDRYNKATKQRITISCPQLIMEYNRHMGGVDLMDSLIGRYHIRMITTKWTSRIFYHLLDKPMTNAYVLYHRVK